MTTRNDATSVRSFADWWDTHGRARFQALPVRDPLHAAKIAWEAALSTQPSAVESATSHERPRLPQGPYRTGEPENDEGSVTVLDSYGNPMDADQIVALLNTYSKLAVADLSALSTPSASAETERSATTDRMCLKEWAEMPVCGCGETNRCKKQASASTGVKE